MLVAFIYFSNLAIEIWFYLFFVNVMEKDGTSIADGSEQLLLA